MTEELPVQQASKIIQLNKYLPAAVGNLPGWNQELCNNLIQLLILLKKLKIKIITRCVMMRTAQES